MSKLGYSEKFNGIMDLISPPSKKLDQFIVCAAVDGGIISNAILLLESVADDDPKSFVFLLVVILPILLATRKVVRGPVNLEGEPWD